MKYGHYDESADIGGWLLSEKFDGFQARWKAERRLLLSSGGNPFNAPDWWLGQLPPVDLVGELVAVDDDVREKSGLLATRGIEVVSRIVTRKSAPSPRALRDLAALRLRTDDLWSHVQFRVFASPDYAVETLLDAVPALPSHALLIPHHRLLPSAADARDQAGAALERVLRAGGEGVVVARPGARWFDDAPGRVQHVLKLKPERRLQNCAVVRWQPGLRNGSLVVTHPAVPREFGVNGLRDEERGWVNGPAFVNVWFALFSEDGIPRHTSLRKGGCTA